MATYKSKKVLEGKTLEKGDVVIFSVKGKDLYYQTHSGNRDFLFTGEHTHNGAIFMELGIDEGDFIKSLDIRTDSGEFPEHHNLKDLTKTTLALFLECEKFNKPKGVVDLSIIPEWKVGDIVFSDGRFLVVDETCRKGTYEISVTNTYGAFVDAITVKGHTREYLGTGIRNVLTAEEALLCFGLTPSDEILELSAQVVMENMPEIEPPIEPETEPEVEEEMVSVQLTKSQYDKLLTLLN